MIKKRTMLLIICFTALVVGLLAGQASAAMYELDTATALKFTTGAIVVTPAGTKDHLTTALTVTQDLTAYGAAMMSGTVGFTAGLHDDRTAIDGSDDGDVLASIRISAGNNAGLAGVFDGYQSYAQNDNDDIWSARLFLIDGAGTHYSPWVALAGSGGSTILTLNMGLNALNFANVTDMGFEVEGIMSGTGGYPSNDDAFHTSIVPVPAAVMLGMLGLAVAGWKLRRFA